MIALVPITCDQREECTGCPFCAPDRRDAMTRIDPATFLAHAARALANALAAAERARPGAAASWGIYAVSLTLGGPTCDAAPQTTAPAEVSPPRGDLCGDVTND